LIRLTKFQNPNCFGICPHAAGKLWFLTIDIFDAFLIINTPFNVSSGKWPAASKQLFIYQFMREKNY